ncbi:MAG: hypothetical protein HYY16_14805 [Planctomycetes bacterium]|nr:hypothetical protein [Planctomycetota bacterium]
MSFSSAWAAQEQAPERPKLEEPTSVTPIPAEEAFGVTYRYWSASLRGDVQADKPGVPGTDVRFAADLDLDQAESFNDLGVWLKLGELGTFRADWMFGRFEETETLDSALTFSGISYAAGTQVRSHMSVDVVTLMYEHPLLAPPTPNEDLALSIELGGKYIAVSSKIRSATATEEGDGRGFIPIVGARASYPIWDSVWIQGEISGLGYADNDIRLRAIDAALDVQAAPWEGLLLAIGYQFADIFALDRSKSDEDVELDLSLMGPRFSVAWQF